MITTMSNMSLSKDEQNKIDDSIFSFINYGDDEDDDNVDLETYIANRRRVKNIDRANGKDEPGDGWQMHNEVQNPQTVPENGLFVRNVHPGGLGHSTIRPDPNNTEVSMTRLLADDGPFFWHEELESPIDVAYNIPASRQSSCDDSPLFVPQFEAPAPAPAPMTGGSQTKLTQGLLSSTYDSSPEKSGTQHSSVRHKTPTHTEETVNPFLDPEYVESLRQNPYTKGILSYKGLSKEEAYARVGARIEPGRKRKRAASPKEVAARVPTEGSALKLAHTQKPEKKQLAASTAASPCTLRGTEKHRGGPPTLPDQRRQNVTLEAFLQSRIRGCDIALTRYGYNQSETSEEWQTVRAEVQGTVNDFADMADGKTGLNASLRQAIDTWDRQVGARVVQQKQVMYTTLLNRIQSMSNDQGGRSGHT